jgi:purine catabolism regulator
VITVDELVAVKSLGVRDLAGQAGGHRVVSWAHVCDLPDPWRWVNAGDLVMTTGGGLPSTGAEQLDWLDQLAAAGVSGLVLAPRPGAPEPSPAMLERADEHRLAVLGADFNTQFVVVARAVIESAIQIERERAAATMRVYEAHAQAVREGCPAQERFARIARAVGSVAWLVDAASGKALIASDPRLPMPSRDVAGVTELALPTRPPTLLLARPAGSAPVDPVAMQHVSSLAALEHEQLARARDRQRVAGGELLAALIDGRLELGAAWPEMHRRGLSGETVLVMCRPLDSVDLPHADLHHAAVFDGYAPLLLHRKPLLFAIVPDDEDTLRGLSAALGGQARLGISAALASSGHLRDAWREANLALAHAYDASLPLVRYGDAVKSVSLVPQDVAQCGALVDAILGPLIRYDAEHDSELVRSLRLFLSLDRSLLRTAEELKVHRQTLVYRLRRVQELTGRSTSLTADVAAFWIAFEAAARTGIVL